MRKCKFLFLILLFCVFANVSFGGAEDMFKVQDPKGDTMQMVSFTPKMMNFPFEIKYPEKWYVREEVAAENLHCLLLTREPLKNATDRYSVGVSLLYNIFYFSSREPSDSKLGKMADTVIKIRDWDESKKQLVEGIKQGGNKIISQSEIAISGQPALRIDYETKTLRATTIYVKVGLHLLMMTLEAPPQEYGQYKDTFEKILNSFFITR